MAQTRKKRRRKHRGTQTGRIDDRGPRGRPRTREEAKARARKKRQPAKGRVVDRRDVPPTWGGAFKRGLFGAAIFFLLFFLLFKRPVGSALALSVVMLGMYVPMGYYIDRFMYQRRLRQLMAERAAKKQQR
ncbi:MAG: hypothetical protein QOI10_3449 [Solirubrobacterales bacterium]|jgi:hypothetical protein|nr:hypothetical protein [Solirubrobacterales bacterium]